MNTYKWSAKHNAFFPTELLPLYEKSWDLSDLVDVSNTIVDVYNSIPPEGKIRTIGSDGLPAWGDIPPPTHEDLVSLAEATRLSLLDEVNNITADWRTELALGIISDEDKTTLIAWMQYIKEVKAVDVATAPEINWPTPPAQ